MNTALYILSDVPYDPRDYIEDNQHFLRKLLSVIGHVSNVHFFFCRESRTYKAYIKIKSKFEKQIKTICWKKQIYDIDNKCVYIDKIIYFEPCQELIVGGEYIFDVETFTDFINGTHKPWKGKIINFSFDEIIVENEDKEIEYISMDKGKVYKNIHFMDEDGQQISTYYFLEYNK